MTALSRRAALLGAAGLAACASLRDPAPGPYRIAGAFEVTLTRAWSDFTPDSVRSMRLISLNGPAIDRLYLAALRSDEGLHKSTPALARAATLTPEDAAAFIAASVDALGYRRPDITRVEQHPFGGVAGVRLTLATQTGDGLLVDGEARLSACRQRLCVILHLAAREHYFAATSPDARAVMDSVRLL